MAINKNIFIHDSDKAALSTLKAIPGFTQVLRLFMKTWSEENMHIQNMAMKIRLSEDQLPEYYNMLPPICDKLGIEIPELYLELDPYANAYTTGDTIAAITITSGLLETIPEDLLPTVLAHECGHIACHHVLYTTMGRWILTGAFNVLPTKIVDSAILPVSAAFAYWMRCSEYSADRAAILCDGTPDKTFEMCMRLAGMDKDILPKANIDAFFNQASEYKELMSHNAFNKFREIYQFYHFDHPLHAVRAWEAKEWATSENFIKAKQYFDAFKNDTKPKEFPMNWTEKHFLGRNFEEVESELYEIGFDNVELNRKTEKQLLTKAGNVINLDINGTDKYKEGDWVAANSKVELTYYSPLTEEEIQAMHFGEIKLPNSLKTYIGKPYLEVKEAFQEIGFSNVETEEIRDIIKEKDKSEGKVADITIDKSPKYSKGEWVDEEAEVKIIYHSRKQQAKEKQKEGQSE